MLAEAGRRSTQAGVGNVQWLHLRAEELLAGLLVLGREFRAVIPLDGSASGGPDGALSQPVLPEKFTPAKPSTPDSRVNWTTRLRLKFSGLRRPMAAGAPADCHGKRTNLQTAPTGLDQPAESHVSGATSDRYTLSWADQASARGLFYGRVRARRDMAR